MLYFGEYTLLLVGVYREYMSENVLSQWNLLNYTNVRPMFFFVHYFVAWIKISDPYEVIEMTHDRWAVETY